MALVTDKFRIYAAESFRDTLLTQNKVFMFVGRAKSWGSTCLLYTSPSPRDVEESRMPSSA